MNASPETPGKNAEKVDSLHLTHHEKDQCSAGQQPSLATISSSRIAFATEAAPFSTGRWPATVSGNCPQSSVNHQFLNCHLLLHQPFLE